MINAYMTKNGQPIQTDFDQENSNYFWLDLQMPTPDEIQSVEKYCGIKIPANYMQNGSIVNRFFHEDQACFMTLLTNQGENIVLILKESMLITINNFNETYWKPAKNGMTTVSEAFTFVVETFIQTIAEALEALEHDTLALSEMIRQHIKNEIVRRTKQTTMQKIMVMQLNDTHDIITSNHSSLVNLQLLLNFSKKCPLQIPGQIEKNVDTLLAHTDFLSNKNSYLHNTVFNYIGITQYNLQSLFNIFSSVFFLPTLVMGFFGMNFVDMPFVNIPNSLYFFIFITIIGSYLIYQYIKQLQFA